MSLPAIGEHFTSHYWETHLFPLLGNTLLPATGEVFLDHFKLVSKVLELGSRQGLGQHICYLFVGGNILESYCSLMYYVPDIVVFDLDMLGLVMTFWVH
jgi:hypothetical protein